MFHKCFVNLVAAFLKCTCDIWQLWLSIYCVCSGEREGKRENCVCMCECVCIPLLHVDFRWSCFMCHCNSFTWLPSNFLSVWPTVPRSSPLPLLLFRTSAPLLHCPSPLPFTSSLYWSCSVVNKFAFLSILMATEHTHTHSHTCTQRHIHTRIHTYWHTLEQRQTVCWMNVLKVCKVYSCNSHKYCGPTSEAKNEPALGQGLRRCCLYSTRAAACWKCMQP